MDIKYINDFKYLFDFRDNKRYLFVYGGRGSGKSYQIALSVVIKLLSVKNVKFLLVRSFLKDVVNSQVEQIKQVLDDFNLHKFFKFDRTTKTFFSKGTGSSTKNAGTRESMSIKSMAEITDAWVEEFDQIEPDDFVNIDGTVRSKKSRFPNKLILSFNACSDESFAATFLRSQTTLPLSNDISTSETSLAHHSTYKINKHLDKQYINSLLQLEKLSPDFYKRYVLGEFIQDSTGAVFSEGFLRFGNTPNLRGLIYWDPAFGTNDGDFSSAVKLSTDGKFIYINEVILSQDLYHEVFNKVIAMCDNTHRILCIDGWFTQKGYHTSFFANEFYRVKKMIIPEFPRVKVDQAIPIIQSIWNSNKIIFDKNLQYLSYWNELKSQLLSFKGKKETAKGKHDDFPDALICGIVMLIKKNLFNNRYNILINKSIE